MTSPTDCELLGLLAEHRVAIVPQAARWLGVSADAAARRIRRLAERDLVRSERVLPASAGMVQITQRGLTEIGSQIHEPGLNLNEFRHDIGVVWLWTAAREGAFGPVGALESERALRTHDFAVDRRGDRTAELKGVGLGAHAPSGRPRRHYPDLMLHTTAGVRVAVELELSDKGPRRLGEVMGLYASDSRVGAVLYVVGDGALGTQVREAADRAGLQSTVQVRQLSADGIPGVPGPGRVGRGRPARARTRHVSRVRSPELER